jgi:hypothetical protein
MRPDRSRLRFVAGGITLVATLAIGRRVGAQTRPSGGITVYKEPT